MHRAAGLAHCVANVREDLVYAHELQTTDAANGCNDMHCVRLMQGIDRTSATYNSPIVKRLSSS